MAQDREYPEYLRRRFPPKEEFVKRMEELLGKEETKKFFEISYTPCPNYIRCNTLKINPLELKKRFENYGWSVSIPYEDFPEIMILENTRPGEIGNSREHLLGYFYVQELSSMLPVIALKPTSKDLYLDLCASPGSKTTQAASMMENSGTIIANDVSIDRISILCSNLERCGVCNTIVTKSDGVLLCENFLKKTNIRFDKILVDAPCTGEGTLRKSPKTFQMWNYNMIKKISRIQKNLAFSALKILKVGGEMVYSTCTLSPEENEEVIDYLISNFDIEIKEVNLPVRTRKGVSSFMGKKYSKDVEKCVRVYPQDNNSDGFFLCKIIKRS